MLVFLSVSGGAHTDSVEVSESDSVAGLRQAVTEQLRWSDGAVLLFDGEMVGHDQMSLQDLGLSEGSWVSVEVPPHVQAKETLAGMGHRRVDYFTVSQAVSRRDYDVVRLMLATGLVEPDVKLGFVHCDVELFDILLEAGLDLSLPPPRDAYGRSAVCLACEKNNLPLCRYLVGKGALVAVSDQPAEGPPTTTQLHTTPLTEAARHHNRELCEFLLQHGADVAQRARFTNPLSAAVGACANLVRQERSRVVRSDAETLEFIRYLLEAGVPPDLPDAFPAFLAACEIGREDVAELLLRHGALVDTLSFDGRTPVFGAVSGNHPALCRYLLDHGADPSVVNARGRTPLVEAICTGQCDCAEALVELGAPVEPRYNNGHLVLLLAAERLQGDVVCRLLETGRCHGQVNMLDEDGRTPLMVSAYHGAEGIVACLTEYGAAVDAQDPYGYSALSFAAEYNKLGAVRALLSAGASPATEDVRGRSPRHLASHRRYADVVAVLQAAEEEEEEEA